MGVSALQRFCNEHNYFTLGTNDQYFKLFEAYEEDLPAGELAVIIWVCSEKQYSRKEILNNLAEFFGL